MTAAMRLPMPPPDFLSARGFLPFPEPPSVCAIGSNGWVSSCAARRGGSFGCSASSSIFTAAIFIVLSSDASAAASGSSGAAVSGSTTSPPVTLTGIAVSQLPSFVFFFISKAAALSASSLLTMGKPLVLSPTPFCSGVAPDCFLSSMQFYNLLPIFSINLSRIRNHFRFRRTAGL